MFQVERWDGDGSADGGDGGGAGDDATAGTVSTNGAVKKSLASSSSRKGTNKKNNNSSGASRGSNHNGSDQRRSRGRGTNSDQRQKQATTTIRQPNSGTPSSRPTGANSIRTTPASALPAESAASPEEPRVEGSQKKRKRVDPTPHETDAKRSNIEGQPSNAGLTTARKEGAVESLSGPTNGVVTGEDSMEIVQTHETEDDAAGKEQDHEPTESPLADPINVGASRPDDTGKNSKESSTTPRRVATPKRKRSDTAASSKPASSAGLPSWLAQPLVISASLTPTPSSATTNPKFGLSPSLTTRLAANGVTHLFPVQQAVLPRLLATRRATSAAATPPQDLLVAAPTGSGKTLAYVLPVVEMLSTRCVIRLRALVVVPTRDLAVQAKAAFESVVSGSASASAAPLRVAVVTGAASFAAEQAQLVSQRSSTAFSLETNGPSAGSSRVDILIATPGRLTDHIRTTPGFTLRHLRFLIVDEADRLMNQRFQGWLDAVLASAMVEGGSRRAREAMGVARKGFERYFEAGGVVDYYSEATEDGKKETRSSLEEAPGAAWRRAGFETSECGAPMHDVLTFRHVAETYGFLDVEDDALDKELSDPLRHQVPLQKLLFSATLTRNPSKIAALHLNNPLYISVMRSETSEAKDMDSPQIATVEPQTRYSVPSTLFERMLVVGSPSDKPVALLHLLYNLTYADLLNAATKAVPDDPSFPPLTKTPAEAGGVLIFAHSVESAQRLAALLQFVHPLLLPTASAAPSSSSNSSPIYAAALTSDLGPAQRRHLLFLAAQGALPLLVSSDLAARGLDLSSTPLPLVLNYTVPARLKTYIHRVGRTARAGRLGLAVTLLESKEARWFKGEIATNADISRADRVVKITVGKAQSAKWDRAREFGRQGLEFVGRMVKGDRVAVKVEAKGTEAETQASELAVSATTDGTLAVKEEDLVAALNGSEAAEEDDAKEWLDNGAGGERDDDEGTEMGDDEEDLPDQGYTLVENEVATKPETEQKRSAGPMGAVLQALRGVC